MIQHVFFTRLLPQAIAFSALMAPPALPADCTGQAVAEVYSHTSFGLGAVSMVFDQSAALRRISDGAGFDGDWIVTEWTIFTTTSLSSPTMSSGGMTPVPEWDATCTGSQAGPNEFLNECIGAIPLTITKGVISWTGGDGAPVGKITAGTAGGAAMMQLNILPNEGGFDWTMTGPVNADPTPVFTPEIFAERMVQKGGMTGHEVTIDVRLTPAPLEMVNTLTLETSYAGNGVGASTGGTSQTKQGAEITLTIWGNTPSARYEVTRETAIVAKVDRAGCTFTKRIPLEAVFLGSTYIP